MPEIVPDKHIPGFEAQRVEQAKVDALTEYSLKCEQLAPFVSEQDRLETKEQQKDDLKENVLRREAAIFGSDALPYNPINMTARDLFYNIECSSIARLTEVWKAYSQNMPA